MHTTRKGQEVKEQRWNRKGWEQCHLGLRLEVLPLVSRCVQPDRRFRERGTTSTTFMTARCCNFLYYREWLISYCA